MRDLRDPEQLGLELRYYTGIERIGNRKVKPSVVYDSFKHTMEAVADYSHDESSVVSTVTQYRLELEERARQGDKHAISMLERGEPGDEPIP